MKKILIILMIVIGIALIGVALTITIFPDWLAIYGGILILFGLSIDKVLDWGSKIKDWKELLSTKEEKMKILPKLEIKLFDEEGQYDSEISFVQQGSSQTRNFGIAIINSTEGSIPAREIDVLIKCYWDGSDPSSAPKIRPEYQSLNNSGWIGERQQIQDGVTPLPAKISFHGSKDSRCVYHHPLEYKRFELVLTCWMEGRFILDYEITSSDPITTYKGKVYINVKYDK